MEVKEEKVPTARRKRAHRLAQLDGVTKEMFIQKTGFSEDQWYYWYGSSKKSGAPNSDQIEVICAAFDWSPTYIFYGIGPERLSEIEENSEDNKTSLKLAKLEAQQAQILEKLNQLGSSMSTAKFSADWNVYSE